MARIPRAAGLAVIAIGVAALAGWWLDVPWLRGPAPGEATLNPATAVALVLLGTALSFPVPWAARGAAGVAATLGLVRLAGYLLGFDPGIDHLLFAQRVAAGPGTPSRVAPQTALGLLLLGTALLLHALPRSTARARRAVQGLAITAGVIALVGLTAQAYGSGYLYGAMALNTSLAFLLVAVGVLSARPDEGMVALLASPTPGGVLARRLVPPIVAIPLLLGWLRLVGQRTGLYDTAGGAALLVVATIVVLVGLTQGAARVVDRAETQLRLLVGNVRDYALFMLDPEGRVASWNPGAQQIKGYTADEIVGQHFSRFYPPEDVAAGKPERALRAAAEQGRFEEENWRLRRDGSRFWASVVMTAVRDKGGRLRGFAKVTRDLTERQRAEAALRHSEERFKTLAVTANDAIISADSDGHITYLNPGAERLFGYAADELTGQPLTVLMPERFREPHQAGMARYLATGEARVVGKTVELAGRKRDGTEFPFELSLASWQRGGAVAFTAIIRDITERKRADETLRRYAAQLEAANKDLEAFSYSVSHDLRAPLRSIDGFSQALQEDYSAQLDQEGKSHLRRVRAAATRMGQLIDDLLHLARVSRAELKSEPLDLAVLARSVFKELREREPRRPVEFSCLAQAPVRGDARLLRIVLQNLLGNAWKFTAQRARAHIELGVIEDNGRPAYFVRDDGAGFDPAYAHKLFGAFQRLHTSTQFEGTGIGLATVARIIHRHGGRVWAEGAVDKGATFYFTL